jgi:hypothetical protein
MKEEYMKNYQQERKQKMIKLHKIITILLRMKV